jgi:L-threonylcarbamoyladenylate synthase
VILDGHTPDAIAQAAARVAAGDLVGLPTETVYGLAADADNPAAVAGIFAAKGRPREHPLIVHVTGPQAATHFARELPPVAQRLMQAFWPGPLTVIVPRREAVARAAAGGQDSVGLRCPSHPVARALLAACEGLQPPVHGLAAPSANRFGRVSPTTAAHVRDEFGDSLLVLDGGPCEVGIESAIIDCTRGQPVLLRPGTLGLAQIQAACGERVWLPHEVATAAPRASGTLASHYAPQAPLRLMAADALQQALDVLGPGDPALGLAVWARASMRLPAQGVQSVPMPADPAAVARVLFAQLRAFDEAGARLIWVEAPPPAPEWDGVRDRLSRAAADR